MERCYVFLLIGIYLVFHSCGESEPKLLKKSAKDARSYKQLSSDDVMEFDAQNSQSKASGKEQNGAILDDSPLSTPKPTPNDPSTPGDLAPKNIDEALVLLTKSKNSSQAYRVELKWYRPKNFTNPDLNLSSSTSDFITGSDRTFYVTRWHRLEEDLPCELMIEYGDRAAQNLSTVAIYPKGCTPDLLNPRRNGYGFNRYGVRKCDTEKATFLGVRNIESFSGAFGIRLECQRGDYFSLHEIWYHPASNHPHRKVLESGGYARPSINGPAFPEIAQQRYINHADIPVSDEFATNPPSFAVQYTLDGSVKYPGVKDGIAMCHIRNDGNFASVFIPSMPIFFLNGGQNIQGLWEPSFTVGSGTYAFGIFWNKNRFGQTIPNGNAAIQFEKIGNTMYHRVNISGFVSLKSKDASNPNHYAGVKNFSTFYCFANPEVVNDATSFRDQNVGDVFDW